MLNGPADGTGLTPMFGTHSLSSGVTSTRNLIRLRNTGPMMLSPCPRNVASASAWSKPPSRMPAPAFTRALAGDGSVASAAILQESSPS